MALARVWTQSKVAPDAQKVLDGLALFFNDPLNIAEAEPNDAANYDAMIIGALWVTAEVMDRVGPRLRIISRVGIGFDRVDLDAATERGIMVTNTPDGPTESTAEHAIALMLALTKRVALGDRVTRTEGFVPYGTLPRGMEAQGRLLGLIGLGRIGGRVAEIARVLGMRVVAYDPFITPARAEALGVTLLPALNELLAVADVVSLHLPALPETHRLINAETLARMKPGSYLINVARGQIIDETALVAALESGHLAGAGLDVFDPEPPKPDNPLLHLPNVVCTPHIASYTEAGVLRMQTMACEQVAQVLRGERPTNLVNTAVWGRHRV